jgi:hypothetical protein
VTARIKLFSMPVALANVQRPLAAPGPPGPRHSASAGRGTCRFRRKCSRACFFSKLRASHRGTSLGPFVFGARACSLCSL